MDYYVKAGPERPEDAGISVGWCWVGPTSCLVLRGQKQEEGVDLGPGSK